MKNVKFYAFRLFAVNVFLLILIYSTTKCHAQSGSHKLLLALSKTDHVLAIINPVTLKVTARIPVADDPHEVIASADGKTAYVSIYGGGSLHTINVIDLIAKKRLADIDTKPLLGPHGLTFVSNRLWFTVEGSKAIGCYDPSTNKIEWVMGTGQDRTHMIYVTNNAEKIYTTNVASGTVSILQDTLMPPGNFGPPKNAPNGNMPPPPPGNFPPMQPHKNWVNTVIPVSKGSEGFDVSPDSAELWTASSEDGTIFIIDLAAKKLTTKIDAKVSGANRLKFTPDGKLVFISSLQSGELTIYNAKLRTEVKRIKIGNGAAGILMDPDGSSAFVACSADNYVAVINLKTFEITGRLDVGGMPDGLGWAIQQ